MVSLVKVFLHPEMCVIFSAGLSEETCLVPPVEAENERLPVEDSYNFITECFFMTHRCINLGQ